MIVQGSDEYKILLQRIKKYLGFDFVKGIKLPKICLEIKLEKWVNPEIWKIKSADLISLSVFTIIGNRPYIIKELKEDLNLPVRGFFCTSTKPIKFNELYWPGLQYPLVFSSVKAKQRITHYHAIFVMQYWSNSVEEAAKGLGLIQRGINLQRIKSSYDNCKKYMEEQKIEDLDIHDRQPCCNMYVDYIRCSSISKAREIDYLCYGLPIFWKINERRKIDYTKDSPMIVNYNDVNFIHSIEFFELKKDNSNLQNYKGESVVVTWSCNIHKIPVQAGFVVLYDN
jgi:hypothetical protein